MPTLISSLSSSLATALASGSTFADVMYTAQQAQLSNIAAVEAAKTVPTVTALSSGDFTTLYTFLSDGGGGTDLRTAFANAMAAAKTCNGSPTSTNQQALNFALWEMFKVAANDWPDLVAAAGGF
jgi:hypothetical protein